MARVHTEVDPLLEALGGRGRYQLLQYFVCKLYAFTSSFQLFNIVYLARKIDHVCQAPINVSDIFDNINSDHFHANISIVTYNKCNIRVKTNVTGEMLSTELPCLFGYQFAERPDLSIISDMEIVCDQAPLRGLGQTLLILGQGVGAVVLPIFSDRFGRRPVHLISHFSILAVGIGAAFSPNYVTFLVLRLLIGGFQQGIALTDSTIGIEIFPTRHRRLVSFLATICWCICSLCLPLMAFCLRNYSWRILQLGCSSVSLVVIIQFLFLDESLRWLVANGKSKEIIKVLKKASKISGVDCQHVLGVYHKLNKAAETSQEQDSVQTGEDQRMKTEVTYHGTAHSGKSDLVGMRCIRQKVSPPVKEIVNTSLLGCASRGSNGDAARICETDVKLHLSLGSDFDKKSDDWIDRKAIASSSDTVQIGEGPLVDDKKDADERIDLGSVGTGDLLDREPLLEFVSDFNKERETDDSVMTRTDDKPNFNNGSDVLGGDGDLGFEDMISVDAAASEPLFEFGTAEDGRENNDDCGMLAEHGSVDDGSAQNKSFAFATGERTDYHADMSEGVTLKNDQNTSMSLMCQLKSKDRDVSSSSNPGHMEDNRHSFLDYIKVKRLGLNVAILWFIWFTDILVYFGIFLNSDSLAADRFVNVVLLAVVQMPSSVVTYKLVDRIGRRKTCMFLNAAAGLGLVGATISRSVMGFTRTASVVATAFFCLGYFGTSAAFSALFFYTPEIFPTNIRNVGLGTCSSFSRLGGMLAPFAGLLTEYVIWAPGAAFTVMCVLATMGLYVLPETKGRELPQTINDVIAWTKREPNKRNSNQVSTKQK